MTHNLDNLEEEERQCALAVYTNGKECTASFFPTKPWQKCCCVKHTSRLRNLKYTARVRKALALAERLKANG